MLAVTTLHSTSTSDATHQCITNCDSSDSFKECLNICDSIHFMFPARNRSQCDGGCHAEVRECKIQCLLPPCVDVCLAGRANNKQCTDNCGTEYTRCLQKPADEFSLFFCNERKSLCINDCKEQRNLKTKCNKTCRSKVEKQLWIWTNDTRNLYFLHNWFIV